MELGHIHGRMTSSGSRGSVPQLPGIATAGGGYRPGATGAKQYGGSGYAPQRGRIGNMMGYHRRDAALQARREAIARRAQQHSMSLGMNNGI